ncbi:MAG: hypothetical protein J5I53_05065 [Bradyrhizobiaceae bacterium]|nr:hypothetical protein [Bradyrhizobiaceae bacterium]
MKNILLILTTMLAACTSQEGTDMSNSRTTDTIAVKDVDSTLACTLTSPELQQRKETTLAELKKSVLERKELPDGFSFRFDGADSVLDQLVEFVKSERSCCSFFQFRLTIDGNGKGTWLDITGPEGAKEFVIDELGL